MTPGVEPEPQLGRLPRGLAKGLGREPSLGELGEGDLACVGVDVGAAEHVGGEAQACGDSSLEIAGMIDDYAPRLRDAATKSPNRTSGGAFADALEQYADGLRERTRGLAEQDETLYDSGNAKIEAAARRWESARTDLAKEAGG